MPCERLYILKASRFPKVETGRHFDVNGITVCKAIQTVESAGAGGASCIKQVYSLLDGGRFPVKRIGDLRWRIDAAHDPALLFRTLFRCLA
jgi:starch synthase (maltosyl-transferring)